jgi:hypothetical protein
MSMVTEAMKAEDYLEHILLLLLPGKAREI